MPTRLMISVVNDDETAREGAVDDLVTSMGFFAEAFECAEDFPTSDDLRLTSCSITDMRMSGMTGLELHNRLLQSAGIISAVLMTAFPNDKDRRRALYAGVTCYLVKPFNDQDLLACVRSALASADSNS